MNDIEKRDQAFQDIATAKKWAMDCIEQIHRITFHFQVLEKKFKDYDNIFYGPVYPSLTTPYAGETVAVQYLNGLFGQSTLKEFEIERSLQEFSESEVLRALRHYELGNANNLSPLEFRKVTYLTAVKAVFGIGRYLATEVIGRVHILAKYWKQAEIDEDLVREGVSNVRELFKFTSLVDDDLLRKLIAQISMETVRSERWLYDVYGYDGYEPEVTEEQPELEVPSLLVLSSKQIRNVARECKSDDPNDQNQYDSQWLAGIKKDYNFPAGDVQLGGGRSKPTIWTLECIRDYLLQAIHWVPAEKWDQEAAKPSD